MSLPIASCAQNKGTVDVPAPEALHALVGDAACSSDADCRTIAVGEKACGGPESYIAWSARHTNPAALSAAAARYLDARRARPNDGNGRASTCQFISDPGARCTVAAGAPSGVAADPATPGAPPMRCTLRTRSAGGGREGDSAI